MCGGWSLAATGSREAERGDLEDHPERRQGDRPQEGGQLEEAWGVWCGDPGNLFLIARDNYRRYSTSRTADSMGCQLLRKRSLTRPSRGSFTASTLHGKVLMALSNRTALRPSPHEYERQTYEGSSRPLSLYFRLLKYTQFFLNLMNYHFNFSLTLMDMSALFLLHLQFCSRIGFWFNCRVIFWSILWVAFIQK